jgi:hypothetical protein
VKRNKENACERETWSVGSGKERRERGRDSVCVCMREREEEGREGKKKGEAPWRKPFPLS